MIKDYKAMSDSELVVAKRAIEGRIELLREEIAVIAAEQERRIAKVKIDSLSPAERDYLKQTIATKAIEGKSKVHQI